MTDRQGGERTPAPLPADMVVHKSARECPIIQPHPRAACGIVQAREANRDRADQERRRVNRQPGGRE